MDVVRNIPYLYNKAFDVYQQKGFTNVDFTEEIDYLTFQYLVHFVIFCCSNNDETQRVEWLRNFININSQRNEENKRKLCYNLYLYLHSWGCRRFLWNITEAFPDVQFPELDKPSNKKNRGCYDGNDDNDNDEDYKRVKKEQ